MPETLHHFKSIIIIIIIQYLYSIVVWEYTAITTVLVINIIAQQHNNNNRFTALCLGLPGWAGTRINIHPPTILITSHHPIFISFFHLLWSTASCLFKLCAWQSFCTTSLHVLFGLPLGLEPSTSYSIHFFATHAHAITSCFAVVPRLYYLFLLVLSTPYSELCLLC